MHFSYFLSLKAAVGLHKLLFSSQFNSLYIMINVIYLPQRFSLSSMYFTTCISQSPVKNLFTFYSSSVAVIHEMQIGISNKKGAFIKTYSRDELFQTHSFVIVHVGV